ncbi:MAG: glycine cleavage system protein GcvH [Anaerolineae bacterium]|nr:glycine cleavage system protein GcvH [Anaerolineae bacterium]NIN99431.1 glycine cleavage system protein GcvH [Anaerolineae bacterium]NIQ82296.1 glycine cleavage system protein GcvH [Anaerolineae bacterium]
MEPTDRKYSREHEWVKLDGKLAIVGITDYAQEQLGDIVYVELPQPGDTLTQFESFGIIESIKAASDLYAPIGGEVVAVNEELVERPELVNEDPYEGGWMLEVQLEDESDTDRLMTAEEYQAHLKTLEE